MSRGLGPVPNSTGLRSTLSMMRSLGALVLEISHAVANTSSVEPILVTTPGLIIPGHHNIAGSRIPPSNVDPFPSRKGPAEPPCRSKSSYGSLSDVKSTSVRFANSVSRSCIEHLWSDPVLCTNCHERFGSGFSLPLFGVGRGVAPTGTEQWAAYTLGLFPPNDECGRFSL